MQTLKEIVIALIEHVNASALVAVGLTAAALVCVSSQTEATVTNNLISGLIGFIGGRVASK